MRNPDGDNMKSLVLFCIFISFTVFCYSCSYTEKTEGLTAEITAAQMEGRKAAGIILSKEWKDTAELQKALLETKARQSKYIIDGKKEEGTAFDSAFISTIRTVNPALGYVIQKK